MVQEDSVRTSLRNAWAESPEYKGQVDIGNVAPGGRGSRPRECRLCPPGCLAYAKQATDKGVPEGAHEFIAAELAYQLGISVPPVGFWTNDYGETYALSVRAYDTPLPWEQYLDLWGDSDIRGLSATFSAAMVFHTWINDNDHCGETGRRGHGRNAIVDYNPRGDQISISFIDHAFSLSKNWRPSTPVSLPSNYYIKLDEIDPIAVEYTIKGVYALLGKPIKSLISRIPLGFLNERTRAKIDDCLQLRAEKLPLVFKNLVG